MNNNKETVRVSFSATTENQEELKRILDHHIDWLIDLDSNHDVISDVYDVTLEKCSLDMKNTEIHYLYRDAGNYKLYSNIVIAGEMTEDQENAIKECLVDSTWFKPAEVGLPDDKRYSGTEDDHDLFEWLGYDIVNKAPTPGFEAITPEDLVQRFQDRKGHWYGESDIEEKMTEHDLYIYLSSHYIAWKLWNTEDILDRLQALGYQPSEGNLQAVLEKSDAIDDFLGRCTDEDWETIDCAIREADRELGLAVLD